MVAPRSSRTRRRQNELLLQTALTGAVAGALLAAATPAAAQFTGPTGLQPGTVTAVTGSEGNSTTLADAATTSKVTLTNSRTLIDWNSFNLPHNKTLEFIFANKSDIVLNRTTAAAATVDGILTSRLGAAGAAGTGGAVWIYSPQGVVFGNNAVVNVAGLLATTGAIADADFLTATVGTTPVSYDFAASVGTSKVQVVNGASITVTGKTLALLAPIVEVQTGTTLQGAEGTTAVFGAAKNFRLRLQPSATDDFELLDFIVPDSAVDGTDSLAPITIAGSVDSGRIFIAAINKPSIAGALISLGGDISATQAAVGADGEIVLSGDGGGIVDQAVGAAPATLSQTAVLGTGTSLLTDGDLSITAGGLVTLAKTNADGLHLRTPGAVIQTGKITANLVDGSADSLTLLNVTNAIGGLGTFDAAGAVTLATASAFSLTGNLTAGAASSLTSTAALTVTSTGGADVSGLLALKGSSLSLSGGGLTTAAAGSAIKFDGPVTLAADTAVSVAGTVNFVSTVNGGHTLTAAGSTLAFGGAVGGTAALTGLGLDAGSVTFASTNNRVGTLAANLTDPGFDLEFTNVAGLTIGSIGGVDGVTTSAGDLTLHVTGALGVTKTVNLGAGLTVFDASGAISQSASGAGITAGSLTANAAGGLAVDGAGNQISTFGTLTNTGAVGVKARSDAAGTVAFGAVSGGTGAIDLDAHQGALSLSGAVTTTGAVTLLANTSIAQTAAGTIDAASVGGSATTGVDLTLAANHVAALQAFTNTTSGTLAFTNAQALDVTGAVVNGTGVHDGGDVFLKTTAGALNVKADVSAGTSGGPAFSIDLDSASGGLGLGPTTLTATGTVVAHQPITLLADASILAGGALSLSGAIDGGHALTLSGSSVTLDGAVGGGTALASLDVTGPTALNGGVVKTTGAQTYHDAVTLGADTALTSSGGALDFAGTIDGVHALTLSGSSVMLGGAVGGGLNLNSLDVTGTTALNGGAVTTTGAQTYHSAATLGADTTLIGGALSLAAVDGGKILILNGSSVNLNGVVGGATALASLDVTGATTLGGNVTTAGGQTYNNAVTLGADVVARSTGAGVLDFVSTVDSNSGGHSLTAATASIVTFGDAIGAGTALTGLGLDAGSVTFASTNNRVGTLAANLTDPGFDLEFTNVAGLTIGSVGGVNGVTTSAGDLTLHVTGALGVTKTVNLGAGLAVFDASGAISQSASGAGITAGSLTANAAGGLAVDGAGNQISTFGTLTNTGAGGVQARSDAAGTVAFGAVSGGTGAISLDAHQGGLSLTGAVATTGGVTLLANTSIAQTAAGTIDAASVGGSATTGVDLTLAANHVAALQAFTNTTSGTLAFTNAQALDVTGAVVNGTGVNPGGDVFLKTTAGALNVKADVSAGTSGGPAFSIDLDSASGGLGLGPTTLTATGTVVAHQPITLLADASILAGGALSLAGAIDGGHALTLSGSSVTLDGIIGGGVALASLDVTGATALNGGAVTTSGAQTYHGAVTLGADTALTSGALSLAAVNGAHDLTLSGSSVALSGVVGGSTALTRLDVTGATTLGANVTTTIGQTYHSAVTLGANAALAGGALDFASTIDGGHGLTLNGASVALNGAVGGATALASLDVTGATALDGGAVTTTGAQAYHGAVTLGADTALTGGGALSLTAVDGAHALTLSGGAVTLGGVVGGSTALASLDVSGLTTLSGGAVTTTGAQTYHGAMTLGANAALTSGALSLAAVNGARTLTLNGSSVALNGAIGGGTALTSLDVTGATTLGANVTTTTGQTYHSAVTLGADVALAGGALGFVSTIDGGHGLTLSGSSVTLGGAVGGSTALASLDLTGPTALDGGAVTTTGAQTYHGPVVLGADTVARSTAGGTLHFASTVDSGPAAHSLTAITSGAATFDGALGAGTALSGLGVGAGSATFGATTNRVGTLAVALAGAGADLDFTDAANLAVGAVGGVVGITTQGGDLHLASAGTLGLTKAIGLGAGAATLHSGGATTQAATGAGITAASLAATAVGGLSVNGAGNQITTFGALANTSAGGVAARSDAAAPVTFAAVSGGAGPVSLTASQGALALTGAVVTSGAASLAANGVITQTAAGAIDAASLSAQSVGGLTLDAANHVAQLTSLTNTAAGDITVRDSATGVINVGTVSVQTGGLTLTADAGSLNLLSNISVPGAVVLTAADGVTGLGVGSTAGSTTISATGDVGLTGAVTAAGNVTVSGAAVTLGSTAAGGDLALSGSQLTVGAASAAGDAVLTATGDIQLASLTTGGDLALSGSQLTVGTASAVGDAALTATGGIQLTSLTTGGDLTLSGSQLTVGTASATGDAVLTATGGDIQLASLTTGGAAQLTAAGGLAVTTGVSVGGDYDIAADHFNTVALTPTFSGASGDFNVHATSAGGFTFASLQATKGDLTVVAAGPLTGGDAGGTQVSLTSGGAISLGGTVVAAQDLTVSAAGAITQTGGGLSAARLFTTSTGGTSLTGANNIAALSSMTNVGAGGLAVNDIRAGVVTVGALAAGTGGVSLTVPNGSLLLTQDLNAPGDISLSAAQGISGLNLVSSGGAILLATDAEVGITSLVGANDVSLQAKTINLATVDAGRDVHLAATGGTLDVATMTVGRDLSATATGAATVGSVTATGAGAHLAISGDSVTLGAAAGVTPTAANRLVLDAVAPATVDLTAVHDVAVNLDGAARLGAVVAGGDFTMTTQGGDAVVASAKAGQAIDVTANDGSVRLAAATLTGGGTTPAELILVATGTTGDVLLGTDPASAGTTALTAPADALVHITAQRDAAVNLDSGFNLTSVVAGRNVQLASASGDIKVGQASAGGEARMSAANGAISLGDVAASGGAGSSIALTAKSVTVATAEAGDSVSVHATSGAAQVDSVTAGGDVAIVADQGAASLRIANLSGAAPGNHTLLVSAGSNVTLGRTSAGAGSVTVGDPARTAVIVRATGATAGDAVVDVGGGLTVAEVSAAAGDAVLKTTGDLTVASGGKISASRDVAVTAGGEARLFNVSAGRDATLAAAVLNADLVTAAGTVKADATGAAVLSRLSATGTTGKIAVTGASVDLTTAEAATDVAVTASAGALNSHGVVKAGGDLTLSTLAGDLSAETLTAGKTLAVNTSGRATLGTATADITHIAASDLTLGSSLKSRLAVVESLGGRLVVGDAPSGVTFAGSGGMTIDAAEMGRITADSVELYAGGKANTVRGDAFVGDFTLDGAKLASLAILAGPDATVSVAGAVKAGTAGKGEFIVGKADAASGWTPKTIYLTGSLGSSTVSGAAAFTNVAGLGRVELNASKAVLIGSSTFIDAVEDAPVDSISITQNRPGGVIARGSEFNKIFVTTASLAIRSDGRVVQQSTGGLSGRPVGMLITPSTGADAGVLLGRTGAAVAGGPRAPELIDLSLSAFSASGTLLTGQIVASSQSVVLEPALIRNSNYRVNGCTIGEAGSCTPIVSTVVDVHIDKLVEGILLQAPEAALESDPTITGAGNEEIWRPRDCNADNAEGCPK